jgi:hypothetical protein
MQHERRPNPDQSPESLEVRLRALPQPPVPASLEARLLAAVPTTRPIQPRRRLLWIGVVAALAAACLLVVLAWPRRHSTDSVPSVPASHSAQQVVPRQAEDSARVAQLPQIRRVVEDPDLPAFNWPLEKASPGRVSTATLSDLLN